jgi:phosphatidylserine/phosphatidylglycerophosphate/cardiolipin synthase-like enzyme
VKITLITSDNLTEPGPWSFDDSKIIKQKKIPKPEARNVKRKLKIISIIFLLMGIFLIVFSILFFPVIYISIVLFILSLSILIYQHFIRDYFFQYYSIFKIRVFDSHSGEKPWSTNLVHSKIFLIDDKICFLGSANFTWSGFRTHYETIIKVQDPKAIRDISQEIEALFNSKELSFISIDDWGKEIYE